MAKQVFFVTGSMGCLGAWTLYHLVKQGETVVSFDLSSDRSRLNLLLSPEEQANIQFLQGDLTNFDELIRVIRAYGVTHIIHLGALQVPFCRANPVVGAQVNVVGTVNIFEAAKQAGLSHLAYASSIAVYGSAGDYPPEPIPHEANLYPHTLYGVYKQANEGTARIYWQDYQLSSTALRAYTVYGLGRDQGLTSETTKALLAVVKGESFHISFGGRMQFQWASDVAQQFILAAQQPLGGAYRFNLGSPAATVEDFVAIIRQLRPEARLTIGENRLPFPESFADDELRRHFATVYTTPLAEGIHATLTEFERCVKNGLL